MRTGAEGKPWYKRWYADPWMWLFAVAGASVMAVALHYGVNPVDSSPVDRVLRDSAYFEYVLYACIPGLVIEVLALGVLDTLSSSYESHGLLAARLSVIGQGLLYGLVGRLLGWLVRWRPAARAARSPEGPS